MSRELQHRLFHYEAAPPAATWERIAAELDESHLADRFPSILYKTELTAPAHAWSVISEHIGGDAGRQFPSALFNLEATPPPAAWSRIEAALDEEEVAPPRPARSIPIFRYAAAAAILAIAAFGAVRILDRAGTDTESGIVSGNPSQPPEEVPSSLPAGDEPTQAPDAADQDTPNREEAALEQSRNTYASLGNADRQRLKRVSAEYFDSPAHPILVGAEFNPVHTYEDLACTDVNTPGFALASSPADITGRYAMLMTPDGHLVRISKKLGDYICCVSGEEQADDCVDQLKKWRQKLADSPVAPSPGNFLDIADMLKVLKEGSL